MKRTVGHETEQHPETRKGSSKNKRKQEKQTKAKKDEIMASKHETIGKAKGVRRKKRTTNEKGNSWHEEKESRAGNESAGNTNGSLIWSECCGRVSEKKFHRMKRSV
jgi:hypothetical protein